MATRWFLRAPQIPGTAPAVSNLKPFEIVYDNADKLYIRRPDGTLCVIVGSSASGDTISQITGLLSKLQHLSKEGHTHPVADITDIDMSQFVVSEHTHTLDDVPGLRESLAALSEANHPHDIHNFPGLGDLTAGKATANHTHTKAQVSGISTVDLAVSGHQHTIDDVTGLRGALGNISDIVDEEYGILHRHELTDFPGLTINQPRMRYNEYQYETRNFVFQNIPYTAGLLVTGSEVYLLHSQIDSILYSKYNLYGSFIGQYQVTSNAAVVTGGIDILNHAGLKVIVGDQSGNTWIADSSVAGWRVNKTVTTSMGYVKGSVITINNKLFILRRVTAAEAVITNYDFTGFTAMSRVPYGSGDLVISGYKRIYIIKSDSVIEVNPITDTYKTIPLLYPTAAQWKGVTIHGLKIVIFDDTRFVYIPPESPTKQYEYTFPTIGTLFSDVSPAPTFANVRGIFSHGTFIQMFLNYNNTGYIVNFNEMDKELKRTRLSKPFADGAFGLWTRADIWLYMGGTNLIKFERLQTE